MRLHRFHRFLLLAIAGIALAGLVVACSSDSPSEPQQQPGPSPLPPTASSFSITLTSTTGELTTGDTQGTTLVVQVRRRDNGAPPPDNTTVTVSTNLGSLGQLGGQQNVVLRLTGGNASTLFFAGNNPGAAIIQARLEASVGQVAINIRELGDVFVSFVNPNGGSPNGGDTVEIIGGGFGPPASVSFDGIVAQVLNVSDTRIRVLTPPSANPVAPGATRNATVNVTVRQGQPNQGAASLPGAFVYGGGGPGSSTPQVFSLSPASGPNEGGTRVTLVGDGFQNPVQVFFGSGTNANDFTGVEAVVESVSANQIVVRSPAATGFGQSNQNATVDILVKNVNSGFFFVRPSAFQFGSDVLITSFSPTTIPYDSSATVTIRGQGFDEPVAVTLGGIAATPISVTGTQILVRAGIPLLTGCQNVTGPVSVTNIETGDSGSSGGATGFTFVVTSPTIFNVVPNSGTGAGGTSVSITGSSLLQPIRVLFGTSAASVTSVAADGSLVAVRTPSFNEFSEEGCDDDGDGQQGMRFVPTSVDVVVRNLSTECEDTFTGAYTYIPTDTSCRGDAAPAPPPTPQCSDGVDNDGDGFVDHVSLNPANPDPECTGATDDDESM